MYLHEVCQPAVIHTTALYSKCVHAQQARLQVLLPFPACHKASWNQVLDARSYMYMYMYMCSSYIELHVHDAIFNYMWMRANRSSCGKNALNASCWDLARQSVEQYIMNVPNPLFLEYYAVD